MEQGSLRVREAWLGPHSLQLLPAAQLFSITSCGPWAPTSGQAPNRAHGELAWFLPSTYCVPDAVPYSPQPPPSFGSLGISPIFG